jgi:hypothetical protein
MPKIYKHSIENFRGIAIVFVMFSHITSYSAIGPLEAFIRFLVADATTFFVFISGYLFAYTEPRRNFNYFMYLKKKMQFVIRPYLLFLVLPLMLSLFERQFIINDLNIFEHILWSVTVGGAQVGPMWFIPMISLFFLFSFVFVRLKSGFLLGVMTVFFLVVSIYTSRPIFNINPFLLFIHFLGFYLLGISFFNLDNFFNKISSSLSVLLIVTCGLVFFLSFYFNVNESKILSDYQGFFDKLGVLNLMQLGKLGFLISLFLFLEKFYNHKNNYLSYLAKISFGLFFIHGYYMIFTSRLVLPLIKDDVLKLLFELIIVIIFSLVTVYLMRKMMPNKSRYVIGC